MLHVICGSMLSGKSTALVSVVTRHRLALNTVWAFKPEVDTRSEGIDSHDGLSIPATTIKADGSNLDDMDSHLCDAVVIDEVQFLPLEAVPVITRIARERPITVAGLDMDAFGQPFPVTASLLACAHRVTKLQAVCTTCGADAHHSQRLGEDGMPVTSGEQVVVGGTETYTARCIECFQT